MTRWRVAYWSKSPQLAQLKWYCHCAPVTLTKKQWHVISCHISRILLIPVISSRIGGYIVRIEYVEICGILLDPHHIQEHTQSQALAPNPHGYLDQLLPKGCDHRVIAVRDREMSGDPIAFQQWGISSFTGSCQILLRNAGVLSGIEASDWTITLFDSGSWWKTPGIQKLYMNTLLKYKSH